MTFASNSRITKNEWVTDPRVKDPDNLPEPLGWTLLVRPYPVKTETKSGLILTSQSTDFLNYVTQIARVVSVGRCCWTRPQHKDIDGKQFSWIKQGDFVSFPRHVGEKVKFKDVSYIVLNDDEVVMKLPDPKVFDDGSAYQLDIPEEDLKTYNTIYNTNYKAV